MAPVKRTIRASEISGFVYCQRAWWYQRKKVKPVNTVDLAAGRDFHLLHLVQSRFANTIRIIAWVLIGLAAIIISMLIAILS